ncbi:hypothetical protein [Psychroflexus maritimus]|uniref:Uncharacterized protein n=1 Tax=Psychroflexus maritimus TaxID=2714865 RepID=A0A967ADI1_9FLAO|nr:hypothetical protein [Psychroflexus maritimus]NGZ89725.1 hypothetical protein [Psychroflexus maritimus]
MNTKYITNPKALISSFDNFKQLVQRCKAMNTEFLEPFQSVKLATKDGVC